MEMDLKIKVLNGVNLDLLGTREPGIYGAETLNDLEDQLRKTVQKWQLSVDLDFFQTNHEGLFLDAIATDVDGILINPGAWTHTSLALADRLKGVDIPYVEVHISNIHAREPIRQQSLISPAAVSVVSGGGLMAYQMGLWGLLQRLQSCDN